MQDTYTPSYIAEVSADIVIEIKRQLDGYLMINISRAEMYTLVDYIKYLEDTITKMSMDRPPT